MKIIGLNSNYDSVKNKIFSGSCALIVDGKIKFAYAEDRISRIKHEGGFNKSLKYILDLEGLSVEDIDSFYISFYANPLIPNEEIIKFHLKEIGIEKHPEKLVVMPSHHFSHACLSYFLSDFNEALIMVGDNEGNLLTPKDSDKKSILRNYCERNGYFWAKGNCITLIERDFENPYDVAFGKAYNIFNKYLGFGIYLNVGKTMGLSSYGELPEGWMKIDLWSMDEYGKLSSNIIEKNFDPSDIVSFFKKYGVNLTRFEEPFAYEHQEYKNLAFFIQHQLNKWAVKKMSFLQSKMGVKNICVSGGVGLNGIMNRELERNLNSNVFVAPYCSDPGQALGNAIYGYVTLKGLANNSLIPKIKFNDFVYLGKEYSDEEILAIITKYFSNDKRIVFEVIPKSNLSSEVAKILVDGKIIAWYQGRSEYGARALGNRSILADPRSIEIRDRVNTLKGRELFRPLAPSVLKDKYSVFFNDPESVLDLYMLRVVNVKPDVADKISGVVHVDGTSRVQTVTKEINPRYFELISKFNDLTDIPMVLNTSFNKAGDPIVESPTEAVESFLEMNLDALVCGNVLIKKNE